LKGEERKMNNKQLNGEVRQLVKDGKKVPKRKQVIYPAPIPPQEKRERREKASLAFSPSIYLKRIIATTGEVLTFRADRRMCL
jgi:hypothetical protein